MGVRSAGCTVIALWSVALPLGLLGQFGQFSSGPSFGPPLLHKKVTLQRRLPPVADASGKTVAVTMAQAAVGPGAELQSALENFLRGGDAAVGGTNPNLMIDCRITAYTKPVITSKTENKVTTQTVAGALSVAFRITDVHAKTVAASGVATAEINQPISGNTTSISFDPFHRQQQTGTQGVHSALDAENALVRDSARQIAAYVVNTPESVEVLLATGGALNGPDKLATSSLWSRDLEELETLPPYPEQKQEAYRLYNIGVANEALGYAAQDRKAALKYLQQASTDYGKALDAQPEEKFFLPPQNRIKTALAHYTDSTRAGGVGGGTAATGGASVVAAAKRGPDDPITNDDVLAMVQARMDEANILDTIQSAPKVNFDLSVAGQVQLTNGQVNGRILLAMKQKARAMAGKK